MRLEADGPGRSPVADQPDSRWMVDADFCFVNVRATGLGEAFGTLIQAAKLFPSIRASAIHLGPFTIYDFGVIYVVTSVETIAPQVVDPRLEAQGFAPEDQLQALVDAAHLLGKTIGFDLEPHVAQFAIPVLMRPECFRWIQLMPSDRHQLAGGLSNDEMLHPEHQEKIAGRVHALARAVLDERQVATLEAEPGGAPAMAGQKRAAYHQITRRLIEEGLWPVLCQAWYGVGVPAFRRYHPDGYAEFQYLDRDGYEPGGKIYGVLTPIAFCHGVPSNRIPSTPPAINRAALDCYSQIFARWRDRFGFDFVRHDSVDHVFDSVVDGNPHHPASDRPSPAVLEHCIAASRAPDKPYIGNLAERMGEEIEADASVGYDVMLGCDMLQRLNRGHLEHCFWLHDGLLAFHQETGRRADPSTK